MPIPTIEQNPHLDNILNSSYPIESDVLNTIKSSKGRIRPSIPTKTQDDLEDKTFSSENIKANHHFRILKTYECWIVDLDQKTIYANGRDIDLLGPEISFEIDINNVDSNDRELIKDSAVFWVKVGILTTGSGQQINKTIIKFRRFLSIPKLQAEKISQREKHLAKALGIDE